MKTLRALCGISSAVMLSFAAFAEGGGPNAGAEIRFEEGKTPPVAPKGYFWCLMSKPETYKTMTEEVEVRKAASYFEMVSAEFETRTESIQIAPKRKEAITIPAEFKTEKVEYVQEPEHTILEIIPARYEWVTETITVTPAYDEEVYIPATYKTLTEEVEVAPARIIYCKGSASDKHDIKNAAGEWCYCAEEIPAKTKSFSILTLEQDGRIEKRPVSAVTSTVKVRKEIAPAEVRKTVIPAKVETIATRVLVTPARIDFNTIPEKTVEYDKLVQVAAERKQKVDVPAKTETLSRQVLDRPAELVWQLMTKQNCLGKYPSLPACPMQN